MHICIALNLFVIRMKIFLPLFFFSLLGLSIAQAQSTAQVRCDALGKGVNLSNWLEGYWQTGWPTVQGYDKNFLVEIKKSGIRSIRLPIYFAGVTDTAAPYAVDTTHVLFERVDSVISWAQELGMKLIIDNHHGWNLSDSTWRPALPRMANLWAVLARRYNHLDPNQFLFEIINEPPLGFSNDSLRLIHEACLDSIRPYAPWHSVVASPNMASIGLGFFGFQPLNDTNIIYTFHTYDPYPFTHQGFSWANPYYAPGEVYPNGNFDFMLPLSWDAYEEWKNTYHLPVFLGEFGVGIYADAESRCRWIDTVGHRIRKNNLSWFLWDVQYDFKLYNGAVIHKDSIIPCFSDALRLYDDSLSTSSIHEMDIAESISVFPNPASDKVTCSTSLVGEADLSVVDNSGRTLYSSSFSGSKQLDITQWPKGMYYLKIRFTNHVVVKKLVVY